MAPAQASLRASSSASQSVRSGPATIAIDGQLVEGRVLSAHAELGLFVFVLDQPDDRTDVLVEGTPLSLIHI